MPEYSSTTITPADAVKTPAMNGSTSGNYTLSALRDFMLASKGQANGLASLDANGKLTSSQLPDLADDVIVASSYATLPNPGIAGKLYITADNNKMYRWDDTLATPDYVVLSVDLSAYATKAEMEAADTDLKNALDATNKRVTNLEVKAGDEISVTYPSSTYGKDEIPTSVAPYAEVEELRGVSRIHNQHIDTSVLVGQTSQNVVFSVTADGELQLSGLASGDAQVQIVSNDVDACVVGHTYLFIGGSSTFNIRPYDSLDWDSGSGAIFTAQSTSSMRLAGKIVSGTNYNEKRKICVTDLNVYFSSDPDVNVASLTLSDIQTKYPELLIPSDYDTGTKVDTQYTSVTSKGINIWDEETELVGSSLYSKNYISVIPSETYYFLVPTGWLTVTEYDADKNQIGSSYSVVNNSHQVSSDCHYIKFVFSSAYGTVYNHDTQICLNSASEKTTYHPYLNDTLSLGQTVTLGSAGSVRETFNLRSGKKTNKLASVDLGSLTWNVYDSTHFFAHVSDAKIGASSITANYVTANGSSGMASGTAGFNGGQDYYYLADSAFADYTAEQVASALSGQMMTYKLATPSADTQLTPIVDPFVEVEGGGSINQNQANTVKIDTSMKVNYLGV